MNSSLEIAGRRIGPGSPVFVVAEIGINHNGDLALARELVQEAARAGADAVKFQKRDLAGIYGEELLKKDAQKERGLQYLLTVLHRVELTERNFADLQALAQKRGLIFFATPWDEGSVDLLSRLSVPAYKVASPLLTDRFLLEKLAAQGKPLVVSTGMSRMPEIEEAVRFLKEAGAPFALLHCCGNYPAAPEDVELRVLERLGKFGVPVGYSGHEEGTAVALGAVALGARIIEKHLTLSCHMKGPDHRSSLEPAEFGRMVREIRVLERALGTGRKNLTRGEWLNRETLGKSLVAVRPIPAGEVITRDHLGARSPALGLSPQEFPSLVGRKARRDLAAGSFLWRKDVERPASESDLSGLPARWGLIARFGDLDRLLGWGPRAVEIHLTGEDLDRPNPSGKHEQELIVHVPEMAGEFYLNLAAPNDAVRQRSLELARAAIRAARQLGENFRGPPRVVLHPGGHHCEEKVEPARLRDLFVRSMEDLDKEGVTLLPENLPPYPWVKGGRWVSGFFTGSREIRELCEAYGWRLTLDLSHAALACAVSGEELAVFLKELRPWVAHYHVADACGSDGEGMQIGEGEIPWPALWPILWQGYDGTWVPEIWRGHLGEGDGFRTALDRLAVLGRKFGEARREEVLCPLKS